MGSKGGGDTTTVQKADPWSGVQPFLLGSQTTRLKQGVAPTYTQRQTWNQNSNDGSGAWEMQNIPSNPASDYETIGSPGIYPESQRLYQQSGWSQAMQDLTNAQSQNLAGQAGQVQQAYGLGNRVLGGAYDPQYNAAERIKGASTINARPVDAAQTLAQPPVGSSGYAAQTAKLSNAGQAATANAATIGATGRDQNTQSLLSGDYDNPYLDQQVNAATRRMTQNFNEQVMPGLRSEAQAAGQYGSSRQGIAEGLAAKGLSQSLSDMTGAMYSNAYNQGFGARTNLTSQLLGLDTNRAITDASALNNTSQFNANSLNNMGQFNAGQANSLGLSNANMLNSAGQFNANSLNNMGQFNASLGQNAQQFNASALNNMGQFNAQQNLAAQNSNATNALNTQQFNANLGLQNNAQALQFANQQLANQQQGLNILGQGNTLQNQLYQNQMGLLDAGNQYGWNNLNRYASIIQPGAGIGGTSSSSTPDNSNPFASAAGGGITGASLFGTGGALAGAMGLTGTTGGLLGAGLGLLMSDRRAKTDIEAVGKLDNGLTVYRFRYIWGGPLQLGVMADEVKQLIPDAVTTVNGFDMVDYGKI